MSKDGPQDQQETSAPNQTFSRRFFSSLKFRIVAVTLTILVATIWILASQAASALRQDMQRTLSDQQFATASSIADNIEDGVQSRIDALRSVAEGITPAMLADRAQMQRFLAERRAIFRLYNLGLFVVSGRGRGLVEQPALGRVDADFSEFEYFRDVMDGASHAVGKPRVGRFARRPVVVFAVPIRDAAGRVLAVLAGSNLLDGNEVFNRLANAAHGKNGHAFLISVRDRLFVNSSRPNWVLRPIAGPGVNRMIDRFVAGENGSGIAVNSEGQEVLISGKNIPGIGWLVTVAIPTAEAFAPILAMERRMYLGATLLTLAFGLLMWLFVRRELQPLEDSVALIRHMSRGTFDLRPMPVQGTQEIRELQSSFNQLQERIVAQQEIISRESSRNALFLSAASDGIHILDEHGCVIEAGATFCRMLGYTREELIGLNLAAWEAQYSGEKLWQTFAQNLLAPAAFQTRHRRRDGSTFDVEVHTTPFELDGHRILYATSRDITERKEAEAQIHHLAFFDSLTALPNRRLLLDRLSQALAVSRRSGQFGALLFLDLDNFKTLNDTQGHDVGDQFLIQVADRLRTGVREVDTVARLGGDEFVVMLENLGKEPAGAATQAEAVAEKIRAALDQPYTLGKHTHHSSASIGVSLFPDNDAGGEEVLKRADVALYQAKDAGRNSIRFYSPAMQFALKARADLENSLRNALAAGELHLLYQPQIDTAGRIIGAEALLRWRSPMRGPIMPADFIPLAEECGLIVPVGRWVLRTACRQLAEWQHAGHTGLHLAVNVSARQFRHPDFVDQVRLELAASGAEPSRLKLELTESLVLDDIDEVVAKMHALREIGVSFAMDDFGTGYSSLAYLKRLPLDQLKIDRSFVRDLAADPDDAEIVRAILAMSRTLRLAVVAEGVETREQWQFLEQHGCDAFQGFLFSRPLPADQFSAMLATAADGTQAPAPAWPGSGQEVVGRIVE